MDSLRRAAARHRRLDQRADRVPDRRSAATRGRPSRPTSAASPIRPASGQPTAASGCRSWLGSSPSSPARWSSLAGVDQPGQLHRRQHLRQHRPRPVHQLGVDQQHGAAAAGIQLRAEPAVAAEQRLVHHARLLGRQRQRGRIAVDEFQLGKLVAGVGDRLRAGRFLRPGPRRLSHPAVPGANGGPVQGGLPSTCSSSLAVTRRSAGSGVSASAALRCPAAPRPRSAPGS